MIVIVASIIFNVLIALIFRWFKQWKVENLPAIVINYFVAASLAFLCLGKLPGEELWTEQWSPFALLLGSLLTIGFIIVAATIQCYGVGITSVFQKTSLVLTASFALCFYHEPMGWIKGLGIPLAVISIFLMNKDSSYSNGIKKITGPILFLPILTFLFNGIIDTLLFYVGQEGIASSKDFYFLGAIFISAGMSGLLLFLINIIIQQKKVNIRDILGGTVLGIVNFLAVLFFIKALESVYGGSVVVPINNVGIILFSALLGHMIFNERFNRSQFLGAVVAVVAILLLSLSEK